MLGRSGALERGPQADLEAKLFSGLADPKRLQLLWLLIEGPRSAGELARLSDLSPSGASNHLRCLMECGLVSVRSDGRFNRYQLADADVAGLLLGAEKLLASIGAEIDACRNYGPPSRRALRRQSAWMPAERATRDMRKPISGRRGRTRGAGEVAHPSESGAQRRQGSGHASRRD